MDYIKITNLKVFAHHGVFDFETKKGQDFYVNAKLFLDLSRAGKSDDLTQSVHYGEVSLFIKEFWEKNTFLLIEAASYHAMKAVMLKFPLIQKIEFELCKPEAPIPMEFENVSVMLDMAWHKIYIGMGSNMGKKAGYLEEAVEKIKNDDDFRNVRVSSFIETKPYGYVNQDDFVNAVLEAETILRPEALLERLHQYEQEAKRERKIHWGPRTLDLDILFYDQLIMDSKELVIPHPDLKNRDFVLDPLMELAPYLRHPIYQKTIAGLREELNNQ